MKILVTGSRGKVGSATVAALDEAGHDVTAVDLGPAVFERSSGPEYRQADLTNAGDAFAVVRGHDAVDPRGGDPRPAAPPAAHGVPEQPDGDLQRARGGGALGRRALRERLERDGARDLLLRARGAAAVRADRRGLPGAAAGPVRARQALRRAADGRGGAAVGHPLHLDPAVVGAVGGQLRAQPRPRSCATPTRRARASGPTSTSTTSPMRCGWRPRATCPATRSSTSPRRTTAPGGRWRR